jgi:hypothetical protein
MDNVKYCCVSLCNNDRNIILVSVIDKEISHEKISGSEGIVPGIPKPSALVEFHRLASRPNGFIHREISHVNPLVKNPFWSQERSVGCRVEKTRNLTPNNPYFIP